MKLWQIEHKLTGIAQQRLFAALKEEGINARGISQHGEEICLSVGFHQKRLLDHIAERLGFECEVVAKGKGVILAETLRRRCGLVIGAAICAALFIIIKNFTLSIEVLTNSEDIRTDVLRLLEENGVTTGTYIPDLECVELERVLKQQVKGISWAGISITDSTLIVDVIENTPEPQKTYERMPSNLVASHNGVIEEVSLKNGQLVKTIGSGVLKGEVLVSGTIPIVKTVVKENETSGEKMLVTEQSEKYVRSVGEIYGSYTEVQTFEQKFAETSLVHSGERASLKKLKIFGIEIPLYSQKPDSLCIKEESYSPFMLFGEQTPIGILTEDHEKCCFSTVIYTEEQAAEHVRTLKERYERNFLSDCEIRGCSEQLSLEEDRAVLTVTYELFGLMSEEKQFFIKK